MYLHHKRIYLGGFSYGASTAILAATKNPITGDTRRVEKVLSIDGWYYIKEPDSNLKEAGICYPFPKQICIADKPKYEYMPADADTYVV